jgi:hypothetical protein
MRFTRYLLPGCLLAAFASPALAQFSTGPGSRYDLIPSVRPVEAEEPEPPVPAAPARPMMPALTGRPAPAVASLEQLTLPQPPGGPADPVGTLAGVPHAPALPRGTYPSPYFVDGPGCCGPLGAHGRIGYEVYWYSGINIPFGPGLPARMNAGWNIGGGARSLFFDRSHTAAWTLDLGLSYTHNWAAGADEPVGLFLRQPPLVNQLTGVVQAQPDRFTLTAIREVHRSSFNYAFGRDVWLMGSGATGSCTGTNVRVGSWIGGRYGTAHVDQVPLDEGPDGYSRRQNVFQGIFVGAHATCDVPMGGWIFHAGARIEYGHDWTNLTPPLQGNMHYINLQLTTGVRF